MFTLQATPQVAFFSRSSYAFSRLAFRSMNYSAVLQYIRRRLSMPLWPDEGLCIAVSIAIKTQKYNPKSPFKKCLNS